MNLQSYTGWLKARYKIIAIAACAYLGVFLGPVAASNLYCDFVAQEPCTSRITGASLPPFSMVPLGLPSGDDCFFENAQGALVPCSIGHFVWPFPPREVEHPESCEEICSDEATQGSEILIMPGAASLDTLRPLVPKEVTVVLGVNNTVYWHNMDDTPKTLNASYGGWSTGVMMPGETAHVTFTQTGVYEYHGDPGPWIRGKIVVVDQRHHPENVPADPDMG